MKTIFTALVLVLASQMVAQPTVYAWRITPDSVCPGDSVKIDYKPSAGSWPTSPDLSTNHFRYNPGFISVWSGNWSILKARPKEHYAALPAGDSTYWIMAQIPASTAIGSYTMIGQNTTIGIPFYVKNCACSITSTYSYTTNYGAVQFQSTTAGTLVSSVYNWDFGTGSGYQNGGPAPTYTYSTPGTYTVKLMVVNPTCQDEEIKTVTITLLDVGIQEYNVPNANAIYYDLLGNKVEPSKWQILIEEIKPPEGTIRNRRMFQ